MSRAAEQLIRRSGDHRKALFIALAALGVLAALATALRGRFTNDVSRLFPNTRESRATFRVLHDAHLADTVQLEFVSPGDVTKHEAYLDATVERLRSSRFAKQVVFRYRSDDLAAEVSALDRLIPRFCSPKLLDDCSPEAAAKNARKRLAALVPGAGRRVREQPFGWDGKLLRELEKLEKAAGMKLAPEFPYFVTTDRHRAMIVVETDARIGDADTVRKLFAELEKCAAPLPPGLEMRIVSGSSRTLGNEEVLKRDAAISGAVSLALFLLIFLWFYRGDRRALWIPLLPLYASLLALGAMTLLFRDVCLYVIGLGGCITGLAVDQGIHVYAAFRGDDAERRTAAVATPMLLSAATSIAVFVFLALTGIEAHLQLAVFAGSSLLLSACLALTALPQLLARDHRLRRVFSGGVPRRAPWLVAAAGALPIAAAAALPAVIGRADFALESLDGTPEKTLRTEREFRAAWRRSEAATAILAASGKNGEEALERLDFIAGKLRERGVEAVMPPRPPEKVQRANLRAWRAPETARRIDRLESECRKILPRYLPGRNADKFFAPFFTRLRRDIASDSLELPPVLQHIAGRMIRERDGKAAAVAWLPETPESTRAAREVLAEHGGEDAALLSKSGFRMLIREELGGRFRWLLAASVGTALLLLFLVFRNAGDVLLAMIPVTVAFSGVTVLMYLTKFRPTPAAAFAFVLLTGLAVDYGIYAVSQLRHPEGPDTRDAILLSAATTVAGAGALLASRHPALFGTGAVLAPGIALACLSGIFLVPMLKKSRLPKQLSLLFATAALMLLGTGCGMTLWKDYPARDEALRRMRLPYPETRFKVRILTTASFPGDRTFRFVLAADIDPQSGDVKLAGVDPGSGALLFKCDGRPDIRPVLGPILADDAPPQLVEFLRALPEDMRRIFIRKDEVPRSVGEDDDHIAVFCEGDGYWRLYRDGKRTAHGRISGLFADWKAEYGEAGREVIYRRFGGIVRKYALSLKIDEIRQVKK